MRQWTLMVLAAVTAPFMATAQQSTLPDLDLNGYCFAPDPCVGEIAIQEGRYYTCEETCTLRVTQAYPQFDMLGLEHSCLGDGQPDWTEFALSTPHWSLPNARYLVTDTKSYTLVPCGTEHPPNDDGAVQLRGPEVTRQLFEELPRPQRTLIQQRVGEAGHFDGPVDGSFSAALLIGLMQYADNDLGHPQSISSLFDTILSEHAGSVQAHGNSYFSSAESTVEYVDMQGIGEVSYYSTERDLLFYELFAISYASGHHCLGDFDITAVSEFAQDSLGYDREAWNLLLQFAQFGIPVTLRNNFDTEKVLQTLRRRGNGFAIAMSIKIDKMLSIPVANAECDPTLTQLEATWKDFVHEFSHPDKPVVDIKFLRRVDRTGQTSARANTASPERQQMCSVLLTNLRTGATMLTNGASYSFTRTELVKSLRNYPGFDFVFFNNELRELATNTRKRRSFVSNSNEWQDVLRRCAAR